MSELETRLMRQADRPGIVSLWQAVFGDDEAFIMRCLDTFAGSDGVFVAADSTGVVRAILSAVPCTAAGEEGIYLYALATAPDSRKGGVMTALMAYAEEICRRRGAAFSALIPATEPLYAYYEKRGYNQPFCLRHLTVPVSPANTNVKVERLTAARLSRLRATYLQQGSLGFSPARFAMLCEDVEAAGMRLCEGDGGYAVFFGEEGQLLLPELFAVDDAAALSLLGGLARLAGGHEAVVTLPASSPLFAGEGQLQRAALYKRLSPCGGWQPPYLRFGFDDVLAGMRQ